MAINSNTIMIFSSTVYLAMSANSSFSHGGFRLELNWKICLFSILMLPLLVSLGFWQLNRAEQKQTIQQALERQQDLEPIAWHEYAGPLMPSVGEVQVESATDGELTPMSFRQIRLEGHYDPDKTWLIENQIYQGRHGYHMITPFILPDGAQVLVNRGWIIGTGYRDRLPAVETPTGELELTGELRQPSVNRLLAGAQAQVGQWPRQILSLNPAEIVRELEGPVWSHVFYPQAALPGVFVTNFQPVTVTADKHWGYALQWFGLAVALIVMTVFANSNLADVLRKRFSKTS